MTSPRPCRPGRLGRLGAVLAGVAVLFPLAACSGQHHKAAASPTTQATASGPRMADRADGVALTAPSGWQQISLGNGTHTALTRAVHDTSVVNQVEQQISIGQTRGLRLFAVKPMATGRPDNLGLAITSAQSTSLDGLQQMLEVATQQYAATKPSFDRVTLPAGPALRVHYKLSDGDVVTQYYLIAGIHAYVLTITSSSATADLASDDAVARSLSLPGSA